MLKQIGLLLQADILGPSASCQGGQWRRGGERNCSVSLPHLTTHPLSPDFGLGLLIVSLGEVVLAQQLRGGTLCVM